MVDISWQSMKKNTSLSMTQFTMRPCICFPSPTMFRTLLFPVMIPKLLLPVLTGMSTALVCMKVCTPKTIKIRKGMSINKPQPTPVLDMIIK